MLTSVLVVSCLMCVQAGLKTGSYATTNVADFLSSPAFLDAVTDAISKAGQDKGDRELLRAQVANSFGSIPGVSESTTMDSITGSQKEALLELVKHLPNLSLRSSGRRLSLNETAENVTYRFQSFDSNHKEGTGSLGSSGSADKSVSEVTVVKSKDGKGFSFTIGPQIAGTFLIGGTLEIKQRNGRYISGRIRAGFVNLRPWNIKCRMSATRPLLQIPRKHVCFPVVEGSVELCPSACRCGQRAVN
ncbi:unnamed protein product [Effrenium voratum]|uniref:Uncharacterized protein n=1 Tax=Effrenium voratum TaxID=2562239 RepID=A0AA36MYT2_9DINO|nr:unnamed protein product [Effrenium voratum]